MKLSDALWGALGAAAVALGVVELTQGRVMLSLSGLVIGALLIATAVSGLFKKGG